LLTKPLGQPFADKACDDVARGSSLKADDDMHRPSWIDLRKCEAGQRLETGSGRGRVQEFAAGKFHGDAP